jgi:hypothetical protein
MQPYALYKMQHPFQLCNRDLVPQFH